MDPKSTAALPSVIDPGYTTVSLSPVGSSAYTIIFSFDQAPVATRRGSQLCQRGAFLPFEHSSRYTRIFEDTRGRFDGPLSLAFWCYRYIWSVL